MDNWLYSVSKLEDAKEEMEWSSWLNKQVFIQLKKGDCYTGSVLSIDENFVVVLDKFNERVGLALSEISKIKEENRNGKNGNGNGGMRI
jgi:small nuclear ribonucleoprotein (snRNP)-like protein